MFRDKRIWMAGSILLIFALGCSVFGLQLPPGSGQDAAGSEGVSQDTGGEGDEEELAGDDLPSLPEPNPINVSVTTEEESSAEASAHPGEDLIFSTTDSRGIVYTLKIPAGALLSPEDIRMMPVSEMQGLPEGASMAAGVHLEPEGLVFLKSATLAIELPGDMSPRDLYALSTMANGEDAYLTPIRQVGQQFIVPIHHFSSPSLTRMQQKTVKQVMKEHSPSDIGRSAKHHISQEVDLENPENSNREAAYGFILKWKQDGLMPLIKKAQKDADLLEKAVAEYVRWHNTLADLDIAGIVEGEFAGSLLDSPELELARAFIHAYEDLSDRCRENNDPVQAARMMRINLLQNALDTAGSLNDYTREEGFTAERINELFEGCVSFLMHFESSFEFQNPKSRWHMQIVDLNAEFVPPEEPPIDMADQVYTIKLRAESELNYIVFEVDPESEKCEFWGEPGTAEYQLKFDANLNYMDFPSSVDLTMKIPELPKEMWDCSDNIPPNPLPSWIAHFWGVHADKAEVGHKGPYEFELPVVADCSAGACEYAREKWPVGKDNPALSGETTITIFHTPE